MARRVALEGFVALAPDFLSPLGGTPADEDKAREMIGKLDPAQTVANGVATVAFLEEHELRQRQGRRRRLLLGRRHGQRSGRQRARPRRRRRLLRRASRRPRTSPKIKAALLLHYAGLDERINAGIDAYKAALKTAGKDFTIYVYDGVNHAFNNDTSAARYNKEAADLAWGRTIAFFKEKLA